MPHLYWDAPITSAKPLKVLKTSAMTEGSLIEELLWFRVISLLIYLH